MNNWPHSTLASGFSSSTNEGMDVIIISTNHPVQKTFWEKRLQLAREDLLKPGAKYIVILEEWKGGAGNGLGTLYAYQKGCAYADQEWGFRLDDLLARGGSLAIYHTAGYGKRLFPLVGSELNNKGAVKLAGTKGLIQDPITILEAVIKQTACLAPLLKGRVAVFWGDQLFIPSQSLYPPTSPVAVLGVSHSLPSEKEWEQKRLSQYGLLLKTKEGKEALLDKVDYSSFARHCHERSYLSLGCFSMTPSLLHALLDEFSVELKETEGTFDTDPHFWMAATVEKEEYVTLMTKKGMTPSHATALHERMRRLVEKLAAPSFLEIQDIGKEALFWDFGTILNYYTNTMKLCSATSEGHLMRSFFDIPHHQQHPSHLDVDDSSILINCAIKKGTIRHSVLVGIVADELEVENSVILYSHLHHARLKKALLYNVQEKGDYTPSQEIVRADIPFTPSISLKTFLDRNGKEDWDVRLPENPCCYSALKFP